MPESKNSFQWLFKDYVFLFKHELYQSTNMYNDDGDDNMKGLDGWGDLDNSFNYDIFIDASM